MDLSIKKKVSITYEEALLKIKDELAKEGFGILTSINVKDTVKEKIGAEFDKYTILGACNPSEALKILKHNYDLGVFLPCNVLVYEKNKEVYISIFEPLLILSVLDDSELETFIKNIRMKFKKALSNIN